MTPSPTDPIRVLIVDDHHVVRLGLRSLLSHTGGFRVVGEAGSVAESVQMAAQLTPDVVLMDIRINGEMDGIETALKIREISTAPIIFLTGNSDENTQERAKMSGQIGYLVKPVRHEDLCDALSKFSF